MVLGVGDCIATITLIYALSKTLALSPGSAAEYKQLMTDFRNLEGLLIAINNVVLKPIHIDCTLQSIIDECRETLYIFKACLQKYHASLCTRLRLRRSRHRYRYVYRKLKWIFWFRREVDQMRLRVAHYLTLINTQLALQSL